MAKGSDPPIRTVEQLREGAEYLKIADLLVRQEKYEAALKEIAKARLANPGNLYALAYEDRVRSLLNAKAKASKPTSSIPQGEERIKPALEQLSSLAVVQAQRSFEDQLKKDQELKNIQREADERLRREQLRQEAIKAKIQSIVNLIVDYETRKEYTAALSEIERAYLLDPNNEQLKRMEARIHQQAAEVSKNKEVDTQRKREEEERFKQRIIREGHEKISLELRHKRIMEEETRQKAQAAKIQQYLAQCREYLTSGQLDEALSTLAFVVVIDPLNQEVHDLDRQIRERLERERAANLEMERRKEEQQVKQLEAISVTIRRHINTAMEMVREQNFEEALRILTRAYIVDPLNTDLAETENAIRAKFDEYLQIREAERKRGEERRRREEEEQLRKLEEEERQRLLELERTEAELKTRENKERIQQYLTHARQYVEERQFENALGEIALAFVVDPFDEDVKQMEAAVHEARRQAKPQQGVSANDPVKAEEELRERIRNHQEHARRFRSSADYHAALEEIAKAFALDPLNEETKSLEADIDREYRLHVAGKTSGPAKTDGAPSNEVHVTDGSEAASIELREAVLRHVARARDFSGRDALDDALKEVHRGLERAPEDRELLRLKAELGVKMQQRRVSAEREQEEAIRRHIERAGELIRKHDYEEALAEIALGLTLDTDNQDLKSLEQSAWEKKESDYRQNNADTTSEAQEAITFILRRARELQEANEFAKALDEIAKAYVLDPVSKEVRKAEIEIRQAELRFGNQEESSLKLIYPNRPSSGQIS